MFSRSLAVSLAILVPLSTAFIELWISTVVFLAASALLLARFLTSSATTAKPLPAAPALAASTAALSASMLVWNAISSIVLIIFPISPDVWLISFIALIISSICSLVCSISEPRFATFWFAVFALSAF